MRENIHNSIANIVARLFHQPPTSLVISAPECGGSHRIRLFSSTLTSRANNYCWPDLAIAQNEEARIILEVEQSGIVSPGRIAGRLLPVSLSACLRNEEIDIRSLAISRETTFIQVVNTALLQPATRKLLQYENLEADIRKLLPLGCIARYFLIPILADDAPPYGAAKYSPLLDAINVSLAC